MTSPSKWWYLLGVLLPVVGCGATLALGLGGLSDKVEAMQRVVVPGQATITLEAGSHTAFYETRSRVDGQSFATGDNLSGLRCNITSSSGQRAEISSSSSSTSYSFGSHAGVSLFDIDVEAAGDYLFACSYSEAGKTNAVVIAIGSGMMAAIIKLVIPAALFGIAGIVVLVVVYRKRKRAMRPTSA
jgi:hypothetical protein